MELSFGFRIAERDGPTALTRDALRLRRYILSHVLPNEVRHHVLHQRHWRAGHRH